ncbi:MAG: dephospho-CoA kinase [Hyphomonadaceae bacterium]
MIILGLTGSIGMGKTATAAMFREAGVPVYDADAAVHALYEKGGAAVDPIGEVFPGAIQDGAVDRDKLRSLVLDDAEAMAALETLVHPLVGMAQKSFRDEADNKGATLIVLDVPLLYETGGDALCDYVAVVTASEALQRTRVLMRPGMDEVALDAILAKQVPDVEKRARADFIISTGHGFDFARDQVQAIIALMIRHSETEEEETPNA